MHADVHWEAIASPLLLHQYTVRIINVISHLILWQAAVPLFWMYCTFATIAGFGLGGSALLNFVIAVELYVIDVSSWSLASLRLAPRAQIL